MEVIAVPQRGPLGWDDFTWLDEPPPVPPDTVIEPPADPLLSGICEGVLISDSKDVRRNQESVHIPCRFLGVVECKVFKSRWLICLAQLSFAVSFSLDHRRSKVAGMSLPELERLVSTQVLVRNAASHRIRLRSNEHTCLKLLPIMAHAWT